MEKIIFGKMKSLGEAKLPKAYKNLNVWQQFVISQQIIKLKGGQVRRIILLTILALFFLSGIAHANLVAYYPFNSNANDVSGNGNNGTVYGNAYLTDDKFGNDKNAQNFDGYDDYIDIGNDSLVNFGMNSFSVTFWVKASLQDGALISKGPAVGHGGMPGWNIQCENNLNPGVRMDFYDGFNTFKALDTISTGPSALDNEWHFI